MYHFNIRQHSKAITDGHIHRWSVLPAVSHSSTITGPDVVQIYVIRSQRRMPIVGHATHRPEAGWRVLRHCIRVVAGWRSMENRIRSFLEALLIANISICCRKCVCPSVCHEREVGKYSVWKLEICKFVRLWVTLNSFTFLRDWGVVAQKLEVYARVLVLGRTSGAGTVWYVWDAYHTDFWPCRTTIGLSHTKI